ncbi:hypothetical protein ACGFS9_03110 [Streptomyces sp. NPDC048566]|uniref:hypothetical protein n=1 Tax=Streptomyces sp. NPDC048566 TaxID=3365569 RepID=UPI00371565EF
MPSPLRRGPGLRAEGQGRGGKLRRRPELRLLYDLSVAYHIPPGEVLDRFTDDEIVHLVAYQSLYGPITPRRLDIVLARHAMDVMVPHLKKGRRPRLRDHLMTWSRADRPARTGREILGIVRDLQRHFEVDDKRRSRGAKRENPEV